jgi:hypothetical protein
VADSSGHTCNNELPEHTAQNSSTNRATISFSIKTLLYGIVINSASVFISVNQKQ